eukprot:tig00000806_g4383.t1
MLAVRSGLARASIKPQRLFRLATARLAAGDAVINASAARPSSALVRGFINAARHGPIADSFSMPSAPARSVEFGRRSYSSLPAHQVVPMPALSPTMTEGNIATWKKNPGDKIAAGDTIAEIETDKATLDFTATDDGYLAKILIPAGSKNVAVNTPIFVMVEEKVDVAAFANYVAPAAGAAAPVAPVPAAAAPAAPATPAPDAPHQILLMPALSPTMTEGNIASWKKNVGDKISAGDTVAEIETDKATLDFQSTEDGFIAKILIPAGSKNVAVNTPVYILVEDAKDIPLFKDFEPVAPSASAPAGAPAAAAPAAAPAAAAPGASASAGPARPAGARVAASPLAKKTAQQLGVDIAAVRGSGPNGRIIRADVAEFAASGGARSAAPAAAPAAAGAAAAQHPAVAAGVPAAALPGFGFVDIPHTQIKKVTAQRLAESKRTVPHYYVTVDCRVDELTKLRERLNAEAGKDAAYKLSVNDFVIKAAAMALKRVPLVNASWTDAAMRQYENADISVAVSTDYGLITPIVRDAERKGLQAISTEMKSLVEKARAKKLQPHEFQGGTFSISNLGMFGIKHFAPIVNPPQAAILGVGGAEKRVIPKAGAKEGESPFEVGTFMYVTLSCDHRVVDGAEAAKWMQEFKKIIEKPFLLLL